ncbi:MAG: TetR/AcrR family transcriptional regulator [Pseudomonadota bacterium]
MDTVEKLLDATERRIRREGYHAVSFRDLADDLGIKSASVHYHFRRKEDLGAAVVERYAERFFQRIDGAADPLGAYVDAFEAALKEGDAICLCGVLGAEAVGLPEDVAAAVRRFFAKNLDWLTGHLGDRTRAVLTLAALEGAMVLAKSQGDYSLFDTVAGELRG